MLYCIEADIIHISFNLLYDLLITNFLSLSQAPNVELLDSTKIEVLIRKKTFQNSSLILKELQILFRVLYKNWMSLLILTICQIIEKISW